MTSDIETIIIIAIYLAAGVLISIGGIAITLCGISLKSGFTKHLIIFAGLIILAGGLALIGKTSGVF